MQAVQKDPQVRSDQLVLVGSAIAAFSGVPAFFLRGGVLLGQGLATLLLLLGGMCGLCGVARFLATGDGGGLVIPAPIEGVNFTLGLDAISAVFLLPVFIISMLGSIYGLSYWTASEHPQNSRKLQFFYGLLAGSLALLVIARDGITFLFAWEGMALSAFFLVSTEDHEAEVREAGWLYLGASHFATLGLFLLFALMFSASGTFAFVSLAGASAGLATAIFIVALVAFGTKAGIMPLHFWLPSAHAMAPSHVSALMSGVLIKMGIYGLVRVISLFPNPPLWWGGLVLGLGAVSGVLGVAFAIGQHDLKRLLAYHSIENIGIIVMGLGLALIGRSLDQIDWIVLGLSGALLHVWNHALFKALLFLSAGSIIHATHTREIDHLGGLIRSMPRTAACFLIGAVAICGLPPLNGFVSEILIYLGLFHTLGIGGGSIHATASFAAASFAAPALALIGALAVACFVKVYGVVFLGVARSDHARHAHEASLSMIGPMVALAALCTLIGIAPGLVAPLFDEAAGAWGVSPRDAALAQRAPLLWISIMAAVLLVSLAVCWRFLQQQIRRWGEAASVTWGCGYSAPTTRMQYTSSSFAEMLVGLFAWALRPRTHRTPITELFPARAQFHSEVPDTVLDEAVLPMFRGLARVFALTRMLQQGSVQVYLLYILAALVGLLLWY